MMKKKNIKNPVLNISLLKIFVSLFIVYHLMMAAVIQRDSVVHNFFRPWFVSYARSLSMDSLRAPYVLSPFGPLDGGISHYSAYFQYEVIKNISAGEKSGSKKRFHRTRRRGGQKQSVQHYRWPPARRESGRVFFNHNRLLAHSSFFMNVLPLSARLLRRHFLPYLCRLHPLADKVVLKLVIDRQIKTYSRSRRRARLRARRYQPDDNTLTASLRCRRRGQNFRIINSEME